MNGAEKVVKHLEMTQAVINHLGSNSLLVKSWSMTIIVAAMVLIGKQDIQSPYFSWCLFFPSWDFGRGYVHLFRVCSGLYEGIIKSMHPTRESREIRVPLSVSSGL
jgi:hypothetical protein